MPPSVDAVPSPDLLTADELHALALTSALAGAMHEIIGDGPAAHGDLAEAVAAIHVLQRMIGAQAAARAYPQRYRLLGRAFGD